MTDQPQSLVPAQDMPLGRQILELGRNLTTVNSRLFHLTERLTEWTSAVENSLRDTEGAKVDFGTWAGGIENQFEMLQRKLDRERNLREAASEAAAEKFNEERQNLQEFAAIRVERKALELTKELQTSTMRELDQKLLGLQTTLKDHMEIGDDNIMKELEELKGVVLRNAARLDSADVKSSELLEGLKAVRAECDQKLGAAQATARTEVSSLISQLKADTTADVAARINAAEAKWSLKMSATVPSPQPVAPPDASTSRPRDRPNISSVLKWTRRLERLNFQTVRSFVKQLQTFVQATGVDDETARALLLQHSDGPVLKFLESQPEDLSFHSLIEKLVERVKPSDSTVLRTLLDCKQKPMESVSEFSTRWRSVAESYPTVLVNRSELRQMVIDNLNGKWRTTARSLVVSSQGITINDLFEKLCEIEGPSLDLMDVDCVTKVEEPVMEMDTSINQVVLPGGRINWSDVNDTRSLLMAWRALMRADPATREECVSWLNRKPTEDMRRGGFRGRPQNRRPAQNRIFNLESRDDVEPELHEDDVFEPAATPVTSLKPISRSKGSVKVLHRSTGKNPRRKPTLHPCNNLVYARNPLMYVQTKLNGVGVQSLVDTGAAASVMPKSKAVKLGLEIDTSRKEDLLAFDGSISSSLGMATVTVNLGTLTFDHDFCVVPSESKVILGNDVWTKHQVLIDPAGSQLRLANDHVVPCQALKPKGLEAQQALKHKSRIRVMEATAVDPVIREDILLLPAGKSFVLPARGAKTIILPFQFSKTTPVYDSGRLPAGIVTSTTTWARHQNLRLTLSNTTGKSIMIGSRSAVGAVFIDSDSPPDVLDSLGQVRSIRRV